MSFSPNGSTPSRRTTLLVAAATVVLGAACLAIDVPVAAWCKNGRVPGDLRKVFDLAEVFGHGIGVGMILLAVWTLDPARRWMIPRLAAAAFGAGGLANLGKLAVARFRPRAFDFSGGVGDTFVGFLTGGSGDSGVQSFPSSHVATAVGLAFAMTWLYPRGRWYFAAMAVLVAGQRIVSSAHFPSDACFGAAVGCLAAFFVLTPGPIARWFDRLESRGAA